MWIHILYTGTFIEGPNYVMYLPGLTPLPIELTCNVTGVSIAWIVNGTVYLLSELFNGALPGHNVTGTIILVNSPVNNTEYVCVYVINDGEIRSDTVYVIIITGEYIQVSEQLLFVYFQNLMNLWVILINEDAKI